VSALAHAHRIEVRDLACSRGPAMLFRNVTLEASAGEWVSIRGSNGSGKTTLLRCVAGLTHPDEGSVHHQPVAVAQSCRAVQRLGWRLGRLPHRVDAQLRR